MMWLSKFQNIDPLQSSESVGGFVCVARDCVRLVCRDKWHDSGLEIPPCCSMGDIRISMENSHCCVWMSGSGNVSTVVIRVRSLG